MCINHRNRHCDDSMFKRIPDKLCDNALYLSELQAPVIEIVRNLLER